MAEKARCAWARTSPLTLAYHDNEWGVPVHDDRTLFEFLILEGAQAGLSWETVLKKREGYRAAFDSFDAAKVARYGDKDIERLLADAGIIRNRAKIEAAITNAQAFLEVQRESGSFDAYVWAFVGGKPIKHGHGSFSELQAKTEQSDALGKDLKRRGFKFVGSTICHAFMQAVGMVNDHTTDCFRYNEV